MAEECALKKDVGELKGRLGSLERTVATHDSMIREMRGRLEQTATKADLAGYSERLAAKIDSAVNGLLRDAISAIPARQAVMWAAVMGVAAVVTGVITVLEFVRR